MKIRVERDGLAEAVAWVARSLPSRPPVPVLGGVLLDAGGDGVESGEALTVAGFDYEVSAKVDVPATIAAEGKALVSGRLLADITKALPAQPVEIAVDGSRVEHHVRQRQVQPADHAGRGLPATAGDAAARGRGAGEMFGQAVAQVAIAAGRDDTLPMLTGVRMEIASDKLTLVATDRFRLAMREFDWQPAGDVQDVAVLVPARTLAEAAKTLGSAGSSVEVSLASGDGLLGLAGNGRRATTPGCSTRSSRSTGSCCRASTPPPRCWRSRRSSRRSSACRWSPSAAPRCGWSSPTGTLRLSAGGDDEGSAEEELTVRLHGRAGHDRVQPGLSARRPRCPAHRPRASVLHHTQPARTGQAGGGGWEVLGGYLYLLMPVRLPG